MSADESNNGKVTAKPTSAMTSQSITRNRLCCGAESGITSEVA